MTTAKPQYSKAMKTALKTLQEISLITITQEEIESLTNEESDCLLAAIMNAQDAIESKFNSLITPYVISAATAPNRSAQNADYGFWWGFWCCVAERKRRLIMMG
jgi:hypothetical protein